MRFVREAALAKELGLTVRTLWTYRRRGILPYAKLGKFVYYDRDLVWKALKREASV